MASNQPPIIKIEDARMALIQQRAWVRHWMSDVKAGLLPTTGSLSAAMDGLDAVIDGLRSDLANTDNSGQAPC